MMYDVIIVGAGPGGIFSAYELVQKKPGLKIAVFEAGNPLSKRHCPIDGEKVKTCIGCKTCAIMSGFGGAGCIFRWKIQYHQRLRRNSLRAYRQKDRPGSDEIRG